MEKCHKDLMRILVSKLRHILVGIQTEDGFTQGNLDRELERIGIAPDGTIIPVDALANHTTAELHAYRAASALLTPLLREQRIAARHELIERAAYTWINRLLALRAMEVRNLIESTLRGEEAYGGISEKLYFLRQDEPQRISAADGGWWAVIEDACTAQAKALPGLFSLEDPNTALRPAPKALLQCIELVNGSQPLPVKGTTLTDLDAVFADPDAIGWAYQFYQEEAKAAIDAKCKRGGKAASRAELAAKTQLFTEPYMVQWLLQNSLGRSYHEAYPQSKLPTSWEYYVTPETLETPAPLSLASLTLLDPCMGSGHFLRAAFDMFVAMYREQHPMLHAKEIADTILSQHLHGIDLDPRAAQLAALTLYLRAWELVRAEQRKTRTVGDNSYIPPMMNLATTPTGLTAGTLERHLHRNPQDEIFKPLLKSIFTGLEQADILGSLLRPREYLDSAIADLLKPRTMELGFNPEMAARRTDIIKLAKVDPTGLRNTLLETIANSFKVEAGNTSDVSVALFGREAEQGMRLLQILDRQYAVVVTNPPYLGSSYMDALLKSYVTKHYSSGKRDLYAAFILRCLELCQADGRVAMVTMQSWMFLSSYAELRAVPKEKLLESMNKHLSTGLLRETCIEVLTQLGPHAFEEISGEVVQSAMFVFANQIPNENHSMVAFRLIGLKNVEDKKEHLIRGWGKYLQRNVNLLNLPGSPLGYWLSNSFIRIISSGSNIKQGAYTKAGLTTGDSIRFYRKHWEIGSTKGWLQIANGGSFKKWSGLNQDYLRWGKGWIEILKEKGNKLPSLKYYSSPSVVLSQSARGSLSARLSGGQGFTNSSLAVFPKSPFTLFDVAAWLNNHCASYIVRLYSQKMGIEAKHLDGLPLMRDSICSALVHMCLRLKEPLVDSDFIENTFTLNTTNQNMLSVVTNLLSYEATLEWRILHLLELADLQDEIEQSTGTPAGWYPLITGYDTLPTLPDNIDIPPLPQELFDYLAEHKRIAVSDKEFTRIKGNLKALYEAGPHAKGVEQEESEETTEEGEEEMASGAHIPIPTETFLEELSVKMELHPISVYWLLEELCAEGVRCKPEEKRLLEDRLSVLVLRLLGHRWPKQLEAGEPVPTWADEYGIIPLVPGTGRATLAERVRERLQLEDGALETQKTEALLHELTGKTLEQWLRSNFFAKHIQQFKSRPIAWHLASTPGRGEVGTVRKKRNTLQGTTRGPAFECLLYYHACSRSALTRIRTQYVEPLLQLERERVEQNGSTQILSSNSIQQETLLPGNDTEASVFAKLRIRELEDFVLRLQQIEEDGFNTPELRMLLMEEPLDRWSGDGLQAPKNQDALYRAEKAWQVDINDGVRVNIAPLQLAGVLTTIVLAKTTDAKKALADRARWRADERRWVRAGKLPRCGWMDEQIPASVAWAERAQSHADATLTQQALTAETGENQV